MEKTRTPYLATLKSLLFECKSGSAIIEYAIVTPVFFLLFMGIIELALIFFTFSVLEGAAAHGSRTGLTGYGGVAGNRIAFIQSEIMSLSGGYLDPAKLEITTLAYGSFANVGQPELCITSLCAGGTAGTDYIDVNGNNQWDADQGIDGPGNGGQIVFYKLEYAWPLFTPLMANIIGDQNGEYLVSAMATVKNEGF